jgi:hypothetical protein
MRIQALFAGIFLIASSASADPDCFDFAREIKDGPANQKLVQFPVDAQKTSGEWPSGVVWAAAKERSPRSLSSIIDEVSSHETNKSHRIAEMEVLELTDPNFLRHQKVKFRVTPFPLINIRWTEDWAVTLLAGSREHPERVLIAYEKTDGTSYIHHLCGFYDLRALPSGETQVYIYEEARATARSQEDTLNGVTATLAHFH